MILELQNLLWVETPKGRGVVKFLIDYGPESDLYWVIAGDNGEMWTVENGEITICENWSLGRRNYAKRPWRNGKQETRKIRLSNSVSKVPVSKKARSRKK